ncbi:hypothetical protein LOD99_13239 [Oopsacas minuta]|uniref:Uncharacterized protein n=1 Tax=Oopsacas minuta TaxID=111878 RepID=A0AAV7JBA8_9METZ|nr:hypothetical protein LOD99_13239 [Oopsacas minuta]
MQHETENSPKLSSDSVSTKVESWLKSRDTMETASNEITSQINTDYLPPSIVVEQIQCMPVTKHESEISQIHEEITVVPERNQTFLNVVNELRDFRPTTPNLTKMKSWIKHWKTQVHVSEYTTTNDNETVSELLATVISPDERLAIIKEALPIMQNISKLYRWQLGRHDRLSQLADSQIQHIQSLEKNLSNSVNKTDIR